MRLSRFLLYLAVVAAAVFFRLAYVGWFGPYLVAAVAAVPPLLFLLSLPSMRALRLSLSAPERCQKGSEAQLRLGFETRARLPLSRVRVQIEIENRFTGEKALQDYEFRSILASDGFLPLPTGACGLLCCRIASCECFDLLGLFSRRFCPEAQARCTVLPRVLAPERKPDLDAALQAAVRLRPKAGGGYSEEHELRPYRPGDSVNSIHWKLSSKTDEVIIREPQIPENNEIYLIFPRQEEPQRGLETLLWLSLELCKRELTHWLAGVSVDSEEAAADALCRLLSAPLGEPQPFDRSMARCVFLVIGGEVKLG